jgi:peptide chain release factor 1
MQITEMAKMQLEEAKERLPELEDEIKFMLIPKDPEDECYRNSCWNRWG